MIELEVSKKAIQDELNELANKYNVSNKLIKFYFLLDKKTNYFLIKDYDLNNLLDDYYIVSFSFADFIEDGFAMDMLESGIKSFNNHDGLKNNINIKLIDWLIN